MSAKYTTYGFKEWQVATTPTRFQTVLRKHMRRATELNGLIGVRAQRQTIQGSVGIPANAPLTVFIKGSSRPLVDSSDLFGSITHDVRDDFTVFVGVLRKTSGFDLATALHEGYEIPVTPLMRGMFFRLWKVSKGEYSPEDLDGRAAELWARRPGGWLPLKDSTTVISVPGRPWVTVAFSDPAFKSAVARNWELAMEATFKELAGKTRKSKAERVAGKAVKTAKKAGKFLGKVGSAAGKVGKRIGKKASKVGKKVAKRAAKIGKKANRTVTKVAKRTTRSVKRTAKKVAKSAKKAWRKL